MGDGLICAIFLYPQRPINHAGQAVPHSSGLFATQCLDFTERRYHLGGALGAAFLSRLVDLKWLAKSRIPRSVRLTANGQSELAKRFSLEFSANQTVRAKLGQIL